MGELVLELIPYIRNDKNRILEFKLKNRTINKEEFSVVTDS